MFNNYVAGVILFIVVSFVLYIIAAWYIYRSERSGQQKDKKSPPKQKDKLGL